MCLVQTPNCKSCHVSQGSIEWSRTLNWSRWFMKPCVELLSVICPCNVKFCLFLEIQTGILWFTTLHLHVHVVHVCSHHPKLVCDNFFHPCSKLELHNAAQKWLCMWGPVCIRVYKNVHCIYICMYMFSPGSLTMYPCSDELQQNRADYNTYQWKERKPKLKGL